MQRNDSEVTTTRSRQIDLYGEPLNVLLGRCSTALSLTQARLSELLGISAPMLSQLINGHRIKIGNPAAAQRLQWMIQIVRQIEAGEVSTEDGMAQLQRNADSHEVLSAPATTTGRRARHLAADVQELCRATASAAEFLAAAEKIRAEHPEVARFLTVFGAERADKAAAYADQLRDS